MPNGITINDYGKFLVVLVALVGGIVLAIVGLLVHDAAGLATGASLATGALGYVFGNGRLASRTDPPATMLAPVLPEHEFVRKDDILQLADMTAARKVVADRVDQARKGV